MGYNITNIDGDLAIGRNAEIGCDADIHGKARVAGNLKVEGFLDAPHIKGAAKGLFNSVEELAKEYPNPRPGWFAIVLDATNKETGVLYKAENRGWVATTDEAKPYEFIKDSINVFASKSEIEEAKRELSDAISLNLEDINNEITRATDAENDIRRKALKADTVHVEVANDSVKILGKTLDGNGMINVLIPAATETKAGVVSAEDKKKFVNSFTWNNDNDPSNMNDFVIAGVYDIKGEHNREDDNLPILNIGGGHSFNARLTVLDSSISGSGENDDKCITQVISFSNRLGQGEVYIRTGKGSSLDSLTWENWSTLQRNVNVDTVTSLDHLVDNGIYSGVYAKNDANIETFVMVVINNYALANKKNMPKSISQFKYSVSLGGSFANYETRVGTGVNDWSEWEILNKNEISSMISAEIEKVTDAHDADVTAIYNAIQQNTDKINAEISRATETEQRLEASINDNANTIALEIDTMKGNAMQYNTLGVNVYADKAEIYGRSIDSKVRTFDFPAATTEKAGVMSAEDKVNLGKTRNFLDRLSDNTDKTDAKDVADYITNGIEENKELATNAPNLALRQLYVAAGAIYNESTGYYELNGITDLTESQMRAIYDEKDLVYKLDCPRVAQKNTRIRTFYPLRHLALTSQILKNRKLNGTNSFYAADALEVLRYNSNVGLDMTARENALPCDKYFGGVFNGCTKLTKVWPLDFTDVTTLDNSFMNCIKLEELRILKLHHNLNIQDCVLISKASVLYIIRNSAPTSAITITLHPDAYARLADDADIVAALAAQPLVTLVSA